MKRALVPGVLVLLLALSGCVSVETSESRIDVTPGASGTYSDGDTTVVVEPLTAETPAALEDTDEAEFLAEVRSNLRPDNVIPNATDEQLIDAGKEACAQISSGKSTDQISVIESEPVNALGTYSDSATIVTAASTLLCPQGTTR